MSPAEDDPQRILIVDDEPAVREALQRSLAFEGYGTAGRRRRTRRAGPGRSRTTPT